VPFSHAQVRRTGTVWTVDHKPLGREDVEVQDYDGDEPTGGLQDLVNLDMSLILYYGQQHENDYGGRWFNPNDRTYGVAFTGSLERHETALRALLSLPERLRVQTCDHSYAELSAVCDRLRVEDWGFDAADETERPPISGFGPSQRKGVVQVWIQPGRADVSQRLLEKYGSLIVLEERDGTSVLF
jgi:hypothetical protein